MDVARTLVVALLTWASIGFVDAIEPDQPMKRIIKALIFGLACAWCIGQLFGWRW